jgi:hypothetical protein
LPEICKKLPRKNVFLAFKNTVKYKRRFDLNHEAVAGRRTLCSEINTLRGTSRGLPQIGARAGTYSGPKRGLGIIKMRSFAGK